MGIGQRMTNKGVAVMASLTPAVAVWGCHCCTHANGSGTHASAHVADATPINASTIGGATVSASAISTSTISGARMDTPCAGAGRAR